MTIREGPLTNGLVNKHRKAAECVSGVLLSEGTVLVEKRRADDTADPGKVLVPGGHVERGESLIETLRREMREELGIRVNGAVPVFVRCYTASDGERQRIHYFHVKDWNGKIRLNEAARVYWESNLENLSDGIERRIVRRLIGRDSRRTPARQSA